MFSGWNRLYKGKYMGIGTMSTLGNFLSCHLHMCSCVCRRLAVDACHNPYAVTMKGFGLIEN